MLLYPGRAGRTTTPGVRSSRSTDRPREPAEGFMADLSKRLRRKRILIVEDDQWVRGSLMLYLELKGCRPVSVSTAEDAIEAIRNTALDVIICDYWLPGRNGLDLLRFAMERQPGARRILITACPVSEIAAGGDASEFDDFIQKPFSLDTFEDCLARCLANPG